MNRPTVFIVDDDAGVRDSLAMLLELKGFRTRTFAAAEAFLAEYRPEWPGCLVLDLRMPGMTGLELQADLARRGSALPVIIITAHGDVATTRSALKGGAVDFIEKPIDDEALVAAIAAALDRDARERERAQAAAGAAERLARLTGARARGARARRRGPPQPRDRGRARHQPAHRRGVQGADDGEAPGRAGCPTSCASCSRTSASAHRVSPTRNRVG